MKIKVIKNAYYVSEDLTILGIVSEEELKSSFTHFLVVGDIWESRTIDGFELFECIEGTFLGELSKGWWEYKYCEDFFKVIE